MPTRCAAKAVQPCRRRRLRRPTTPPLSLCSWRQGGLRAGSGTYLPKNMTPSAASYGTTRPSEGMLTPTESKKSHCENFSADVPHARQRIVIQKLFFGRDTHEWYTQLRRRDRLALLGEGVKGYGGYFLAWLVGGRKVNQKVGRKTFIAARCSRPTQELHSVLSVKKIGI